MRNRMFASAVLSNFARQSAAAQLIATRIVQVVALALSLCSLCMGWGVPHPGAQQLQRGLFLADGPADFVRNAGAPTTEKRSFSLLNRNTEYRLQIFNGGISSQFARVSSAVITVNGQKVVSPSDFNQNVGFIERVFTPAAANSLTVELRSNPKSGLTLQVVGVDNESPVISVISPQNGTVVSDQLLNVTGMVTDAISGVESVTCDEAPATLSGASFSCSQVLNEGENGINVQSTDKAGNNASTVVNVTWNPEVIEEGEVQIQRARLAPDVIFVGESEQVTVSARIPNSMSSGMPPVMLQRVDTAGNVLGVEGVLLDHGDAAKGDLLKGDGIFTFRGVYTPQGPGQLRFRVSYQQDGSELKSKALSLGFYNRPSETQINTILSTQQAAAHSYATLSTSMGEASARNAVIAQLRQNAAVMTAELTADGNTISVLYAPGILGGIYLQRPGMRGGGSSSGEVSASTARPVTKLGGFTSAMPSVPTVELNDDEDDEENKIQSKRAIVLSPFRAHFAPHDEGAELEQLLKEGACPNYEVTYAADQAASVDSFKNLDRYGIIAIISHGTRIRQRRSDVFVLLTSEQVAQEGASLHMRDLLSGRLTLITAIENGTEVDFFGILPSFIPYYSPGDFPNSLIYLAACESAANDTLAQAFFGQGAKTYLGFSKEVSALWAREVGLEFFNRFIGDPMRTTGGEDGAHIPDQYDINPCLNRDATVWEGCDTPEKMDRVRRRYGATFDMLGSEELERPNLLINGGFETGDLEGWGSLVTQESLANWEIFVPSVETTWGWSPRSRRGSVC